MRLQKHTLLKTVFASFICITIFHNQCTASSLPDAVLDDFLTSGGWSEQADDVRSGEKLDSRFIKGLVEDYENLDPRLIKALVEDYENNIAKIEKAVKPLGLLVLAEAVAGWGVNWEADEPKDPANNSWSGPSSVESGKHLMSYAKGGVGIPHADSGFLEALFDYLKKHHPNLASEGTRFFLLKGINFDVLYANGGHCNKPVTVISTDLDGKEFDHKRFGYAGDSYCKKYEPRASTNEKDWQIFRHWIREALRKRDVQEWIIGRWLEKYWMASYEMVVKNGGEITEALINARIRNSSPVTANCAIEHARNTSDPVAAQLEAYTLKKCRGRERHSRRFGVMKRPVVIYEAFSKQQ